MSAHPERDPAEPSDEGGRPEARPDWLVGAEDVDERPLESTREHAIERMPRPSAAPPPPPAPVAWSAAASSVPTLPGRAAPVRSGAGRGDEDRAFDDAPDGAGPADAGADADAWDAPVTAPPPAYAPLHEPWWMVALDELRSKRRVQVFAALGIAGLVALATMAWNRDNGGTPLARIQHEPATWDGQSVTVHGRVADVYPVGGGYAFYLVQGRDTIVTFTRSRVPTPRERVVVTGQISTGYLDGAPRQALFETAAQ